MLMNCVELSDMCGWSVVLLLYHLVFLHKISQYLLSPSEDVIVLNERDIQSWNTSLLYANSVFKCNLISDT